MNADVARLSEEANVALIRGDIDGYLARIEHAPDYTLMAPFGGATEHGFKDSPERRAAERETLAALAGTPDGDRVLGALRRIAEDIWEHRGRYALLDLVLPNTRDPGRLSQSEVTMVESVSRTLAAS